MNSVSNPRCSIALPTLNAMPYIQECIASLLAQRYQDWEVIVCDSYSSDGTWEYLQGYQDDHRFKLFQVPMEGLYAGWNECLKRMRGDFVYIATADDTCSPFFLDTLIKLLDRHADIDIAVSGFRVIDPEGSPKSHKAGQLVREYFGETADIPHIRNGLSCFILHACLGMIWWSMSSVVFRRHLLEKIGPFRTDRGSQADEEWEMRAYLASDCLYWPEKLATWRVHDQQATASLPARNRTNLACIEAVIDDPLSGIPESWRNIPGMRNMLTTVCRMEYYDSYHLYGNRIKTSPVLFLADIMRATVKEPGLVFRQARNGFRWDNAFSPDGISWSNHLMKVFDVPWVTKPL
jgi:glycosyltransferase involved in cell wall biosynthesis